MLAGVLALVLAWGYWRFEVSLPRGPAEFVTWPPLEPLPFAPLRGFSYEQLARHAGRFVLLAPAALIGSWALTVFLEPRLQDRQPGRRLPAVLAGAGLALCVALFFGVFAGRALIDDELVYAQQAELLSRGLLAEAEVPPWAAETFTVRTSLGATGKYLWGEPLVQTLGVLVGWPALLHLPLLLLTLVAWHAQLRDLGEGVAEWATAAVALSPMVLFTTATGLSHATSLCCVVLGGLGVRWLVSGERAVLGALLAGNALGFAAAVRLQTALPIGAVLVVYALSVSVRQKRFGPAALMVSSGAFWGLLVVLYNRALTGGLLTLPWSLYRPVERYGFGQVLEGDDYVHSLWRAVENLVVVAVRFNGWWLGLPFGLGVLLLWWILGRPGAAQPHVRLWFAAGAALVLFHVPYYSTGVSETGPMYLYELVLPLSLVAAAALREAWRRWPTGTWTAVVVHLLLGTAWFVAENAARIDRQLDFVHGAAEQMLAGVEPPALVLYETAPQETVRLGWINGGFPKRWRHPQADVVTYPRGDGELARGLREHYADRSCWYYRVDPARMEPQLLACNAAEELLARPERLPGRPLAIGSTAMRKGLLDPFAGDGDAP
ncbi:MAG: hypothetical protein AAGA81_00825 [Acidobacteriota bacterium]